MARPEGGEKGVVGEEGEEGSLGKAETLGRSQRKNAPQNAGIWRYQADSQLFSSGARVALRTALPIFLLGAVL